MWESQLNDFRGGFVWAFRKNVSINILSASSLMKHEWNFRFEKPFATNRFNHNHVILINFFVLSFSARYFSHSWQHYKHDLEYFNLCVSFHSWKSLVNDKRRKRRHRCLFVLHSVFRFLRKLRSFKFNKRAFRRKNHPFHAVWHQNRSAISGSCYFVNRVKFHLIPPSQRVTTQFNEWKKKKMWMNERVL